MAFDNFKGKKFTAITASAETTHQSLYRKTPAVLRLGKKEKANGGFFNYDLILSASDQTLGASYYSDHAVIVQQDTASLETFVGLTASLFRDNMDDFLQSASGFSPAAYTQLSASFFAQIGEAVSNISASDAYVGVLTAPFESGSIGSGSEIIPPPTCSIIIKESPGIAYDTSGASRSRKVTYLNSSSNFTNSHFEFTWHNSSHGDLGYDEKQITQSDALVAAGLSHLTRSFGQQPSGKTSERFYYVQAKPVTEFSFEMTSSNSTSSFYALTSSFSGAADFGLVSGNLAGQIIEDKGTRPKFYNQVDATDGAYLYVVQKGYVEGEGEEGWDEADFVENGSSLAFTPQQLLVWYSTDYNYSNVRSASYYFTPYPSNMHEVDTGATTKALVTGSISSSENIGTGEVRTLYWLNHTYTGSFTSSFGYSTRAQLKDRTGEANNTQLPFMDSKTHYFSKKQKGLHSSHLWKDQYLSQPADEGYYVHSASFSQASKNQMTASLGSANHSSSFYVMGVFKHPFVSAIDGFIMNYTASQHREVGVDGDSWISFHPIASCMFLKRYDDEVFIWHPSASGFVTSESVG
jgi:hypothetical protein